MNLFNLPQVFLGEVRAQASGGALAGRPCPPKKSGTAGGRAGASRAMTSGSACEPGISRGQVRESEGAEEEKEERGEADGDDGVAHALLAHALGHPRPRVPA